MIQSFHRLASHVLRSHQELAPCIIRIHTGFMADEQHIVLVEKRLQNMQETLRIMRETLKAPNRPQKPSTRMNSH